MENDLTKYLEYDAEVSLALAPREEKSYPPFWKPARGSYAVKFVSEARLFSFKDKETGEEKDKVFVDIAVGGVVYTWGMGRGSTSAASSVQVAALGSKMGKLTGTEATVIVKETNGFDGKLRRDFTVVEAQAILSAREAAAKAADNLASSVVSSEDIKHAFI